MKLKKIISALTVLALSFSMVSAFTSVEAASLGGKPTIKAELVEYTTNTSKSWAKAWVKITVDMTAAETLSAYKEDLVYDEIEEDDVLVKTGNGLTTAGFELFPTETAFVPQDTNTTVEGGWSLSKKDTGYNVTFGPKTEAVEYYTKQTAEFIVNFKVTSSDFDKGTTFNFVGTTLDGTNTTDNNATWSYSQIAGTIAATDLKIPSYNEWANPTPAGPSADKAEGTAYDTYTFENLEEGSVLKDKKVLMQKAAISTEGMDANTRFVVTSSTGETKTFGSDIWSKLDVEGDGVINVSKVIFGLIVDAAETATFTFDVQ